MTAELLRLTTGPHADEDPRHRALFDHTPMPVFELDREGCLVRGNAALSALLRLPVERLTGLHWHRFSPSTQHAEVQAAFERCLEGQVVTYLTAALLQDGRRLELEVTNVPIVHDHPADGGHRVTGVYGLLRDISARRDAEWERDHLAERLRALADRSDQGVFVLRTDPWRFAYANPAFAALLGEDDPQQLTPDQLIDRLAGDGGTDLRALLDRCSHRSGVLEVTYLRPQGSAVVFSVEVTPVLDPDGHQVGVQGIVTDVSAAHAQAELLATAVEQQHRYAADLQELYRLKASFVQVVAHEIRTPLTIAGGFAATLRAYPDRFATHQIADMAGRIEDATIRLGEIVQDVAILNRADPSPIGHEPEPTNLGAVLGRLVALRQQRGEHEVRLEHAADVERVVDGPLIERAVGKLIDNALRHSPAGTPVWVSVDTEGTITVADAGPGIPVAQRQAVFEPMWQGEAARTSHAPGVGLGLAYVQRVAEIHEAEITVDDRPGGGARFRLHLP